MTERWEALLAERVDEATRVLLAIPGVRGLVIGGSVGRGEAWPLSDIDILPIRMPGAVAAIERQQVLLVDWWAGSGRAQALDVGWLAFTKEEVGQALAAGPAWAAERMRERRWFHGLDKAFGGYGVGAADARAEGFARWATGVRFAPAVVVARLAVWGGQARDAQRAAHAAATLALREGARALRLVLIEGWGERLGSMGREWTRFERIAARHGAADLARRIAVLADADPATMRTVLSQLPHWLRVRIELAHAGRRAGCVRFGVAGGVARRCRQGRSRSGAGQAAATSVSTAAQRSRNRSRRRASETCSPLRVTERKYWRCSSKARQKRAAQANAPNPRIG